LFSMVVSVMVRIKTIWYWKRYMRKDRYRCKRYRLFLPNSLGEALNTDLDYVARLIGPAIVVVPKGLESLFSRLEKLENAHRENTTNGRAPSTDSLPEDSRIEVEND
jgi:hypothetical protein